MSEACRMKESGTVLIRPNSNNPACTFFSCRYNEISLYDYNNPPQTLQEFNDAGYGHFTQVFYFHITVASASIEDGAWVESTCN